MSVLDFIAGLVGMDANALRAAIREGINASPDSAPLLSALLVRFDEAVTSESLAGLAAAIPTETKELLLGHLDPRRHPSDAA